MSRETRAQLLEEFGFSKRWVRYTRPVRIVDALASRNGDHWLAWVHVDSEFGGAVRWIRVRNFTRFYRPHTPGTPG